MAARTYRDTPLTRTPLSWKNWEHTDLLQRWNSCSTAYQSLRNWEKANPHPGTIGTESKAWHEAHQAKEKELGFPAWNDNVGRLQWDARIGVWSLQIGDKGQGQFGHYLRQCPQCGEIFATADSGHKCCSDECDAKHGEARLEAKRERRKEREKQISAALASRKGICLACGSEFDLKRTTGKTCSETCRKRLQRTPGLSTEHLQLIPVRKDLEELRKDNAKVCNAASNLRLKRITSGQHLTEEEKTKLKALEDYRKEMVPILEAGYRAEVLNSISVHAPALAAWLIKQPEEVQAEALSYEGQKTVLGDALAKKLKICRS